MQKPEGGQGYNTINAKGSSARTLVRDGTPFFALYFTEKDLIHRQGQGQGQGRKTPCPCLLLSAERQNFSLKFVQFSTKAK
nr:MAG TPA: hypothetical protein [Caudoviricetes sp.]